MLAKGSRIAARIEEQYRQAEEDVGELEIHRLADVRLALGAVENDAPELCGGGCVADVSLGRGLGWNELKPHDGAALLEYLKKEQPLLVAGGATVAPTSTFLTVGELNPEDASARRVEREGLATACRGYAQQVKADRFFLHEMPDDSPLWDQP